MGEISRDIVLEWMRKAFVQLKVNKHISYGMLQREAAVVFVNDHRELAESGENLERAAERNYQKEPQSFVFWRPFGIW